MTASNSTPGDGHESSGTEFEHWMRRELGAILEARLDDVATPVREIAAKVEEGDEIDPSTISAYRQSLMELNRVLDGALLAAGPDACPPPTEVGERVHSKGVRVRDAAVNIDERLENDEPVTDHDVRLVREAVWTLQTSIDDVVRCYQGGDK